MTLFEEPTPFFVFVSLLDLREVINTVGVTKSFLRITESRIFLVTTFFIDFLPLNHPAYTGLSCAYLTIL